MGRGTMVWMHRCPRPPSRQRPRARPTPRSSRPSAAVTIAPSSSSTRATSAGSPPTCSAWSRTTAAPRTSRRRSSSPRCAGCARPTARSPSSRGSTRSPRTPASTSSAAPAAPRRSRWTPTRASARPTTAGSPPPSRRPDDAVDAKQQLDHLCGAFGGLSDSHHEILVLREFEGLSYREIGDRMGLSRPAVESTLFRARKRLTEEYDELVSGARCLRIQSIIAAAGGTALGARDARRLARHLSHCQPCRRKAMAAGLDISSLPRDARPPRRRARRRLPAAARLPARAVLRERADGAGLRADGRRLVQGRGGRRGAAGGRRRRGRRPARRRQAARAQARQRQGRRRAYAQRQRVRWHARPAPARRRAAQAGGREVEEPHRRASTAPRSASPRAARPRAARARRAPPLPTGGSTQPAATSPTSADAEPDARRPRADRRRDRDDDAEPAEGHAAQDRDAGRLHTGRRRGRADRQRRRPTPSTRRRGTCRTPSTA